MTDGPARSELRPICRVRATNLDSAGTFGLTQSAAMLSAGATIGFRDLLLRRQDHQDIVKVVRRRTSRIEEALGPLKYEGRPVTLDDMSGIEAASRRHKQDKSRGLVSTHRLRRTNVESGPELRHRAHSR